jgi:hypothetical protein
LCSTLIPNPVCESIVHAVAESVEDWDPLLNLLRQITLACAAAVAALALSSPGSARAADWERQVAVASDMFFGTGSPRAALESQRDALIERARDRDPGVRLSALTELAGYAGMPRVREQSVVNFIPHLRQPQWRERFTAIARDRSEDEKVRSYACRS